MFFYVNYVFLGGSVLTAGTISTPWTPVSGPAADANGAGPDTKNLDVGDVSDVSKIYILIIPLFATGKIIGF